MTERDRITFYIMIGMQMTDRARLLRQATIGCVKQNGASNSLFESPFPFTYRAIAERG